MSEQRILVGSTQTIVSYPRVSPSGALVCGQPSSAQVRVGTPAVSLPSSFSSATVDTLSTTVGYNADEGEWVITLGATQTLVSGRQYLVQLSGDEPLVVTNRASGSVNAILCTEPLPMRIYATSTVLGFAVYTALTAEQTAQPGPALALWRATISGVTYEWHQPFRVVRRLPTIPLTPAKLTETYPVIHTLRARTDRTLQEVIEAAWNHRVVRALNAKGIQEEDIVSSDVLEPALAAACLFHLVHQGPEHSPDYVMRLKEDFEQSLASALASRHWYEEHQLENPSPAPDTESPTPNRATLRLTR